MDTTVAGRSSRPSSFCGVSNSRLLHACSCPRSDRMEQHVLLSHRETFLTSVTDDTRQHPVQSCAMRRRVYGVTIVLAVVMLASFVSAEPISSLKPTDCVNDFAGVLSPTVTTQLKEMCRQVLEKAQASVVVATIKSTDGEEIFNYAVALYQKWGIGQKGKDRGVLILLAVQDRKYYINVGYGLEGILPD